MNDAIGHPPKRHRMSNVILFQPEASMRAGQRGNPAFLVPPVEPLIERMLGAIRQTHAMLAKTESALFHAAAIEQHLPEPARSDYAARITLLKLLLDIARDRASRI